MGLRSPVSSDVSAVLTVVSARETLDFTTAYCTRAALLAEWGDPGCDVVVAELPDMITGYATVDRMGARVIVAPAAEGRGIGTRLRLWAEERERARGHARHRQAVAAANARARALLAAAGYGAVRGYWRMGRRLTRLPALVPPPAGVTLRAPVPQADAGRLHALDDLSFAGNADYEPQTPAAFAAEHLTGRDCDPALGMVAEHDGLPIGFLLTRRWEAQRVAYIDLLAVHPGWRRRGVATALLGAAFAACAAAGLVRVELGVATDNPAARRLYERVGLSPRFRVDTWERPVTPARPGSAPPDRGSRPPSETRWPPTTP